MSFRIYTSISLRLSLCLVSALLSLDMSGGSFFTAKNLSTCLSILLTCVSVLWRMIFWSSVKFEYVLRIEIMRLLRDAYLSGNMFHLSSL